MLKKSMSFISAFVLSFVSLFALYVPNVSAATLEWSGSGSDNLMSNPDNWVGGSAPVSGDNIVIPAAAVGGDSCVSPRGEIQNDLDHTTISLSGVSFTGFSGADWCDSEDPGDVGVEIWGNPLTLTGDVTSDSANEYNIRLNTDVYLESAVTFTNLRVTNDNNHLHLNGNNLTGISAPLTFSEVYGPGEIDVRDGSFINSQAIGGFDGPVRLYDFVSLNFFSGGSTGNVELYDTSSVGFGVPVEGTSYDANLLLNSSLGSDSATEGAIRVFTQFDYGETPSDDWSEPATVLLTGAVTLNQNTYIHVPYNAEVEFENLDLNGHSLMLSDDAEGVLKLDGNEIKNPERETTIDEVDEFMWITNPSFETLILTGSIGGVSVRGILKGTGSATTITVMSLGTLAPGLSPGCMQVENLNFNTGATYQVELAGTEACDEYDQMQVSSSVTLNDATLDVSFLDNFVPSVGDEFVIILNEGSDPVDGTFDGLVEGAELTVNGVTFTITYEGGDGDNDVVLTVTDVDESVAGSSEEGAPDAPDTGFALIMANPIVTLLLTLSAAGALVYISRRQFNLAR